MGQVNSLGTTSRLGCDLMQGMLCVVLRGGGKIHERASCEKSRIRLSFFFKLAYRVMLNVLCTPVTYYGSGSQTMGRDPNLGRKGFKFGSRVFL